MKTNSILLRGSKASGKSFIAEAMASMLSIEKVLRVGPSYETLVGIARKINAGNYDLIIFDECISDADIRRIDKFLNKYFDTIENRVTTILYLSQSSKVKSLEGFRIIECTYKFSSSKI